MPAIICCSDYRTAVLLEVVNHRLRPAGVAAQFNVAMGDSSSAHEEKNRPRVLARKSQGSLK